jgi:hypothetical protein
MNYVLIFFLSIYVILYLLNKSFSTYHLLVLNLMYDSKSRNLLLYEAYMISEIGLTLRLNSFCSWLSD